MHIKLKNFFIGHLDQLMNFYFKFLWGRCSIVWQSPLNITVLGRACARRGKVELRLNSPLLLSKTKKLTKSYFSSSTLETFSAISQGRSKIIQFCKKFRNLQGTGCPFQLNIDHFSKNRMYPPPPPPQSLLNCDSILKSCM